MEYKNRFKSNINFFSPVKLKNRNIKNELFKLNKFASVKPKN